MTPSASRRPRGRPRQTPDDFDQKRLAIAEAARTLFAQHGYSAVSIRRVAVAAGVTPMTIYRYFDAKVDLLRFLWAEVFGTLFDLLERVAASEPDAHARLLAVARGYVRFWTDHPEHYRMVFMAEGVSQPEVSVFALDDDVAARFYLFARCVADVVPRSQTATIPEKTQLLVCALQGIAHTRITISAYPWLDPDGLVESLVDALVRTRARR
ncbi:MAG: TetR/AcrR family transcriptional regulator [Gemmatimonadaceae bacterium]|jgi:AcrR family transcriptional regulator|nr:TetR/AcrR family transcriptional regulator [Gemmatimonadaceae bacterium]